MGESHRALKALYELHQQYQHILDEIALRQRQISSAERLQAQKQQELVNCKARLRDLRLHADQKNLELKSKEQQLNKLREQLNTANTNREYEILSGQIEADLAAKSVLEDEILELLGKIDLQQQELGQLEREFESSQRELERLRQRIESELVHLKHQAEMLAHQFPEAERFLPSEVLSTYRRAVQAFGAGALSRVEGNICTSCYLQITKQRMVELRAGKLLFCSCGRLLVLVD